MALKRFVTERSHGSALGAFSLTYEYLVSADAGTSADREASVAGGSKDAPGHRQVVIISI